MLAKVHYALLLQLPGDRIPLQSFKCKKITTLNKLLGAGGGDSRPRI